MQFATSLVKWSRKQRSKFLMPIGKLCTKLKIKPNYITILAMIMGIIAVYYLFRNNTYFVILIVIHLVLDALDGVVARANNNTSRFGAHLDNISDRLILILVLIKSYYRFNDYFVLVVLAIYLLHHLIFALTNLEGKVSYSRSLVLIIYCFGFYEFGFFLVGVLSLYGLSQQFNQWIKKKFTT